MGSSWSSQRGVKRPHEEENSEASGEASNSDGKELNTPKRLAQDLHLSHGIIGEIHKHLSWFS